MPNKYKVFRGSDCLVISDGDHLHLGEVPTIKKDRLEHLLADANLGAKIRENEAMGFSDHALINTLVHSDIPKQSEQLEIKFMNEWGPKWKSAKIDSILQETWRDREPLL